MESQVRLRLDKCQQGLQRRGGQGRLLDQVSLSLSAGDFVAIQGPSGCGKSTLLLTAGTLLQPDAGDVRVNGQSLAGMLTQRALLRSESIGFVFQQFHLVPYLSVLDNVLAPALAAQKNGKLERA